jgi:hypothetical protein
LLAVWGLGLQHVVHSQVLSVERFAGKLQLSALRVVTF